MGLASWTLGLVVIVNLSSPPQGDPGEPGPPGEKGEAGDEVSTSILLQIPFLPQTHALAMPYAKSSMG